MFGLKLHSKVSIALSKIINASPPGGPIRGHITERGKRKKPCTQRDLNPQLLMLYCCATTTPRSKHNLGYTFSAGLLSPCGPAMSIGSASPPEVNWNIGVNVQVFWPQAWKLQLLVPNRWTLGLI